MKLVKQMVKFLSLVLILQLLLNCSKDESGTQRPGSKNTVTTSSSGPCGSGQYDDWRTSSYVLPYPVGTTYSVNLSHCGGSYHSVDQPDQFAIDFDMKVGTLITSSRAGDVVFVEESGLDNELKNNLVIIRHSDGSYLQYMHLKYQGALVTVGQAIAQGDEIGLSGNTGLAGYPHLHFVATKKGSFRYPYESFPTTFQNTEANDYSLLAGIRYTAMPY